MTSTIFELDRDCARATSDIPAAGYSIIPNFHLTSDWQHESSTRGIIGS